MSLNVNISVRSTNIYLSAVWCILSSCEYTGPWLDNPADV